MWAFGARILILSAILIVLLFPLGPALIHQDPMREVDAVVLLLGKDSTRVPEAMALLHEGWAKTLIVPAMGEVSILTENGEVFPKNRFRINELLREVKDKESYKSFWENTHIELCLAKEIMIRENLSTVAVVTSPYHTRRVRFMADRVFGNKNKIIIVPSRFEKTHGILWLFNKGEQKYVFWESVKNLWFFAYSNFS